MELSVPDGYKVVACKRCGTLRLVWSSYISQEAYNEEDQTYSVDYNTCEGCKESSIVYVLG